MEKKMTDRSTEKLNIPGSEAELREEQLSHEFRIGRIMMRVFAAGVTALAVLFGFIVYQIIRLNLI